MSVADFAARKGVLGALRRAVRQGKGFGMQPKDIRRALTTLDDGEFERRVRGTSLGFDTDNVWYHGTNHAGFREFALPTIQKTRGTGIFASDDLSNAATYSSTDQLFDWLTPEAIWRDPGIADLRVRQTAAPDDPDQLLLPFLKRRNENLYDLSRREYFSPRRDAYEVLDENLTKDDVLRYIGEENLAEEYTPSKGVYPLYARTPDRVVFDFQGENWDSFPGDREYGVFGSSKGREPVEYFFDEDEAQAFAAAARNHPENRDWYVRQIDGEMRTSDDLAREARDMEADAALMTNIHDYGAHGREVYDTNTLVVMDPANLRHTSALFDPAKSRWKDLLAGLGGVGVLGALQSRRPKEA